MGAAAEAQAKEAMAARAREMWQQTSAQAKEVTASRAREMWQHQVWFAQHQGFATGQPHSFHWQQSWNGGAHNTWATLQQGWTAQQQDWATGQQTFSAGQQGWTAQQDWATGHQVWTTGQQSFDAGQEAWAHMQQARAAMMRSSLSDIWHAMAARNQASWMHAPPVAGMKEETAGMLAAMQSETTRQHIMKEWATDQQRAWNTFALYWEDVPGKRPDLATRRLIRALLIYTLMFSDSVF